MEIMMKHNKKCHCSLDFTVFDEGSNLDYSGNMGTLMDAWARGGRASPLCACWDLSCLYLHGGNIRGNIARLCFIDVIDESNRKTGLRTVTSCGQNVALSICIYVWM